MAYLVISREGHELERRELAGPVTIGRAVESDICIADMLLSRKHCRIFPDNDGWVVEDLGSRNGTYVNGEPARQARLNDGDVLHAGGLRIGFHAGPLSRVSRPQDPAAALSSAAQSGEEFSRTRAPRQDAMPRPLPRPAESPQGESFGGSTLTSHPAITSDEWRREQPLIRPAPLTPPPAPDRRGWLVAVALAVILLIVLIYIIMT